MTAKQLKAKAPFFWQAVEDGVYDDCKQMVKNLHDSFKGTALHLELTDDAWVRIAHNAAFIATSEFVSRGQRTPKKCTCRRSPVKEHCLVHGLV